MVVQLLNFIHDLPSDGAIEENLSDLAIVCKLGLICGAQRMILRYCKVVWKCFEWSGVGPNDFR